MWRAATPTFCSVSTVHLRRGRRRRLRAQEAERRRGRQRRIHVPARAAQYRRLHAKGDDWVRWPLTTTPVSFHRSRTPPSCAPFACALYDLRSGKPRPAPRALFALDASVANASRSGRAASMAASCGAPAEQEREKPEEGVGGADAAPRHRIRAAAHARVNDGGITRIGSKGSKDVQGGQKVA